ncbi:hypothetical protein B4R78_05295, partial [Acinetobacter nosocomialis]
LLALMVVWGYPCESKSSPAHYSKHPNLKRGRGVALWAVNQSEKKYLNIELQIILDAYSVLWI